MKKPLKIVSFILGPLIPLTIAVYVLFPYLNEEKHREIANAGSQADTTVANQPVGDSGEVGVPAGQLTGSYLKDDRPLLQIVDSLRLVNDSLENELASRTGKPNELAGAAGSGLYEDPANSQNEDEEESQENIRSFLSLEDEQLAPILKQMSDEQLIQLFKGGSSLQRRKLLRTLDSKRAAGLMTEVM